MWLWQRCPQSEEAFSSNKHCNSCSQIIRLILRLMEPRPLFRICGTSSDVEATGLGSGSFRGYHLWIKASELYCTRNHNVSDYILSVPKGRCILCYIAAFYGSSFPSVFVRCIAIGRSSFANSKIISSWEKVDIVGEYIKNYTQLLYETTDHGFSHIRYKIKYRILFALSNVHLYTGLGLNEHCWLRRRYERRRNI